MVITKSMTAKNVFIILLALCLILTASSCSPAEPAPSEPPENIPPPVSVNADKDKFEMIEMYDLFFSVPAELEMYGLSGAEQSTYVNFERDDSGSDVSWMSISPKRPGLENTADFPPTVTDTSGTPVLTEESVTDQYDWETEVRTVFSEGALTVGGMPGAHIEVELVSEGLADEIWRVRLTRAICNGIAYDFLYASISDHFDKYLPTAEGIIASARFESENPAGETTFWDITMRYPTNGVQATVSDEQVFLLNNRNRGNPLRFYAKHDDTVLYTDELLDDSVQVNRLFRIWSYNLVDQRFRKFREPWEILREETEINGKRVLRAVYHDDWEHNQYDEYMEVLLFVHNYDLYILQIKGEVGHKDALSAFTQPIIDSVSFGKTIAEPPAERPMPYSDTVKWITDTYAILTIQNGADTDLVGGYLPTKEHAEGMREGLFKNWDITDRESSDEAIQSLYQRGHRARFREFAEKSSIFTLEPDEFEALLEEIPDAPPELRYIYENTREAYRLYGDNAILAWDYCRIIYLYCSGYIAGYYTYGEALDLSLPIALELQGIYSSWGEMYRDYMAGFHFWSPGDAADPSTENHSRTQIMLNLEAATGESALLPWDAKLAADWRAAPQG